MDNKNQELHKLIIEIGRVGDVAKLMINEIGEYHQFAAKLLAHALPGGKENCHNFLKGLVLLENSLQLGSTSQIWKFMKRLDLYTDAELMDWILAKRNNPYVPFGSFGPPLEVRSYSQYLEYESGLQAHREEMVAQDMERSRLAKERKEKARKEHEERKRVNDEKRRQDKQ